MGQVPNGLPMGPPMWSQGPQGSPGWEGVREKSNNNERKLNALWIISNIMYFLCIFFIIFLIGKIWYLNNIWVHLDRRFEISIQFCICWWVQIHFFMKSTKIHHVHGIWYQQLKKKQTKTKICFFFYYFAQNWIFFNLVYVLTQNWIFGNQNQYMFI